MPEGLNSKYNEGPIYIDDKSRLAYLTRNMLNKEDVKKTPKEENVLEILIYELKGSDYILKEKFTHNNSKYSVGHACYSELTERLYFTSKNVGGEGGIDLYFVKKINGGEYGDPVNLGRRINTGGNEVFPMLKNGILYFSSTGLDKTTKEDLDIYYVTELGILNGEKPKKEIDLKKKRYGITPTFFYARQAGAQEINLGLLGRFDIGLHSIYTGYHRSSAIYRFFYRYLDAVVPQFLINLKEKYTLGLSYDINISKLNLASRYKGGLEISFSISGFKEQKGKVSTPVTF